MTRDIADWIVQCNLPDVKTIDVKLDNTNFRINVVLKDHDGSAVSSSSLAAAQTVLGMMLPSWLSVSVTTPAPAPISFKCSIDPGPVKFVYVAKYAGRECPCGMLSGCEYHHV